MESHCVCDSIFLSYFQKKCAIKTECKKQIYITVLMPIKYFITFLLVYYILFYSIE